MYKYVVTDSNEKEYGRTDTEEQAFKLIREAVAKSGFTSYYTRVNILESGKLWIDYGSHTHFFFIEKEEVEEKL